MQCSIFLTKVHVCMERSLMSQIRYESMSAAELKQYFLKHRGDRAAVQAYLDRINQRSN